MKHLVLFIFLLTTSSLLLKAQNVGINGTGAAPHAAAILDLNTGNVGTLGFLPPHASLTNVTSASPFTAPMDQGLLVYDTNATTTGGNAVQNFCYWDGALGTPASNWVYINSGEWVLTGNSNTLPGSEYIGTNDGEALELKVDAQKAGWLDYKTPYNTFFGWEAGNAISTGTLNTALGFLALKNNTKGSGNIAFGDSALYTQAYATATNSGNIGIGNSALFANTPGAAIAWGTPAPEYLGSENTAIGEWASRYNTTGYGNTAGGFAALYKNTTGSANSAFGLGALDSTKVLSSNAALGFYAGHANSNDYNVFIGDSAGVQNFGSGQNTYIGYQAGLYNPSGTFLNTAVGAWALWNGSFGFQTGVGNTNSVGLGAWSLSENEGSFNVGIGYQAFYYSVDGQSDNVAIGDLTMTPDVYGGNQVVAIGTEAGGTVSFAAWQDTIVAIGTYADAGWGINDIAIGYQALYSGGGNNSSGYGYNIAIGSSAGYTSGYAGTGTNAIYIGYEAGFFDYGTNNTFIGTEAGTHFAFSNKNNVVCVGYSSGVSATTRASDCVYLGNGSNSTCYATPTGFTTYSDRRIKDSIKENVPGLTFLTKLHPVTYHINLHRENELAGVNEKDWPSKYNVEKIAQSGFIAQEVDSAATGCGYNFSGIDKPQTSGGLYALNYTTFVVPLVKAVKELNEEKDSLQAKNKTLKAQLANLQSESLAQQKIIDKITERMNSAAIK